MSPKRTKTELAFRDLTLKKSLTANMVKTQPTGNHTRREASVECPAKYDSYLPLGHRADDAHL